MYLTVLFYVFNCVVLYIKWCYSMYCLCRLYCSMYSLCVNVYCTTATGCQPNRSKQIYIISYHINTETFVPIADNR